MLAIKLWFLRCLIWIAPNAAERLLRDGVRKEMERTFGNCQPDVRHVAAAWIRAAAPTQTFIWSWRPGQVEICVTDCVFARHLGAFARICCDEDQSFLNRLVTVEKTSRIAYGQSECRIVLRDR